MRPIRPLALILAVALALSACKNRGCDEFAPPTDRIPTACLDKAGKPAVTAAPAMPKRYCYQSLGQVDCYDRPQPQLSGFNGSYPN